MYSKKLYRYAFSPLVRSHDGNSVSNMYVNGKVVTDFALIKDVRQGTYNLTRIGDNGYTSSVIQKDETFDVAKINWIKFHKKINKHEEIPEEVWMKRDYLDTDYYLTEMKNWSGSGSEYAKLIHNGNVLENFFVMKDDTRHVYITRTNIMDVRGVRPASFEHQDIDEAMELLIEQYEIFSGSLNG